MQFLVIHGADSAPRACAMLCNLVHLLARQYVTSNCANTSLTPPIVPAYRFLLKYTSRDEVDVLAKGSGGTVDMRNNIAQYEETSPLFGLLRYRRRNVIIKYLPEGCSRLIQGMSQPSLLFCCPSSGPVSRPQLHASAIYFREDLLTSSLITCLQHDSPSTLMRSVSASPLMTPPSTSPRPRN